MLVSWKLQYRVVRFLPVYYIRKKCTRAFQSKNENVSVLCGVEKYIGDLEGVVFHNEVSMVGVQYAGDILRATDANIVKEVQAECDDLPLALKASIDSLGDADNECFLDLVLFLEDKKICGDALLDICVHVQNLQRCDAFGELHNDRAIHLTLQFSPFPLILWRKLLA
ncbi:hypothetical protein SUGI_1095860 [Cryptomeria japonica]|nr:hypothetical protein SUGI_1095860 [Cryptomeria japonica]